MSLFGVPTANFCLFFYRLLNQNSQEWAIIYVRLGLMNKFINSDPLPLLLLVEANLILKGLADASPQGGVSPSTLGWLGEGVLRKKYCSIKIVLWFYSQITVRANSASICSWFYLQSFGWFMHTVTLSLSLSLSLTHTFSPLFLSFQTHRPTVIGELLLSILYVFRVVFLCLLGYLLHVFLFFCVSLWIRPFTL